MDSKGNPVLAGAALESAIAAKPHPKVTAAGIEAKIASVTYFSVPDAPTVTMCSIKLHNGYSVRGESACVDPRNYDKAIGDSLAYKDAFGKLRPLEGYLLAEQIYASAGGAIA